MTTCPACAQIVEAATTRCPACGNDLRARRLAHVRIDRDEELEMELLVSAVIAETGTHRPPPPLVPSLDARMTPRRASTADHPWDGPLDEVRDLLPADTLVRRRFLRRR